MLNSNFISQIDTIAGGMNFKSNNNNEIKK